MTEVYFWNKNHEDVQSNSQSSSSDIQLNLQDKLSLFKKNLKNWSKDKCYKCFASH